VVLLDVPQNVTGTDTDTDLGEGVDPTALNLSTLGNQYRGCSCPTDRPKLCVYSEDFWEAFEELGINFGSSIAIKNSTTSTSWPVRQ
jgi:hypothetical protein